MVGHGRVVPLLAVALVLALAPASRLRAQEGKLENHQLNVTPLAGQKVALLPVTYVVADPEVESDSAWQPWADRAAANARADSLVDAELARRSPEVNWVMPAELRKIARRAGGMLPSPDEMGQAMLRNKRMKEVPDQLAAPLRRLVAIDGGRMVLVPAAVVFSRDSAGTWRSAVSLALVDARRAAVVWRSVAVGQGSSPDLAVRAAAATVFP